MVTGKVVQGPNRYDHITTPLLLISIGTGIAPFINLLSNIKEEKILNQIILAHGCRKKDIDLYQKEFLFNLEKE